MVNCNVGIFKDKYKIFEKYLHSLKRRLAIPPLSLTCMLSLQIHNVKHTFWKQTINPWFQRSSYARS